jgi:alkyl hydroperoxide reductase subunit AhpF
MGRPKKGAVSDTQWTMGKLPRDEEGNIIVDSEGKTKCPLCEFKCTVGEDRQYYRFFVHFKDVQRKLA